MIARLLRRLEVPRNRIEAELRALRKDTQTTERRLTLPRPRLGEVRGLDELAIESVAVLPGAAAVGASAISLDLRNRTGAMMVGLRRGGALVERAGPAEPFEAGDVVYLVGTGEAIGAAERLLGRAAAPDDGVPG